MAQLRGSNIVTPYSMDSRTRANKAAVSEPMAIPITATTTPVAQHDPSDLARRRTQCGPDAELPPAPSDRVAQAEQAAGRGHHGDDCEGEDDRRGDA